MMIYFLLALNSLVALAANHTPSSGRPLAPGHWLTCWGGAGVAVRRDPPFNRNTSLEEVAQYVPTFSGAYQFEVKDTWEEWVTHSGVSCSHCGETCTKSESGESCTCNSCSWQELETFYRPWSYQRADWKVTWIQDQAYQRKRREWWEGGKKPVSHDVADLAKLLEFDPDRPLEYFLFPGEVEVIELNNGEGSAIHPSVSMRQARHDYRGKIYTTTLGTPDALECDDRDLVIEAQVMTGKRLVTTSPNSIEFRKGWHDARTNAPGEAIEEPVHFEVVDIAAQLYEGQNIFDHYKDSQVGVRLREIDRAWWFDRTISNEVQIGDNRSILKKERNANGKLPSYAVFEFQASDLMRTPLWHTPFHLHPGKSYQLCARVLRKNNIYYKQKHLFLFDAWSEPNCGLFSFKPPQGYDLRSPGRKFRDTLTRITTLPWW